MIVRRCEGCEVWCEGLCEGFAMANSLIRKGITSGVKDVKGFPHTGMHAHAHTHAHTRPRLHPSHPSHPSQGRKENGNSRTYGSSIELLAFTLAFTAFTLGVLIMAVLLSVKAKVDGVRADLNRLRADMRDRAIAAAVNDTINQVKTAIKRDIRQTYNLTAEYIEQRLVVKGANRNGIKIEAKLSAPGRQSANLIRFLERKVTLAEGRRRAKKGTQRGVFIQVKRGGAVKLVRGAFIGNNGRTVFRRTGAGRLPIYALQTVDVPQAMFRRKGVEVMQALVQERFSTNLRRQIQRFGRTEFIKVRA
jgi:hypothetical protein